MVEEVLAAARQSQKNTKDPDPETTENSLMSEDLMRAAEISDQLKFVKKVERVGTLRILIDIYFPMVAGGTSILVVWSSTNEFPGWGWVGIGASVVTLAILLSTSWWKRRDIYRWYRKKKGQRRSAELEALIEEFKKLPPDAPSRDSLQKKAKDLLSKNIEDLRKGYY